MCLQVQRFEGGERQRYFADDDKRSLDDLVREQRYAGAANTDGNMADNIMRKGKRFRCRKLCAVLVTKAIEKLQSVSAVSGSTLQLQLPHEMQQRAT